MQQLLALDHALFLLINHLPHTALSDSFAMFLSGIGQWGFVWIIIAVFLFLREEKHDHWFFFPLFFSLGLSWVISELLLKTSLGRLRPSEDLGAIIVAGAANFSFPSTHATIAFALAYILSQEEPRVRAWFYILAVAISLSRIYLGVHYPIDVIAGSLVGWGIGYTSLKIERMVAPKRAKKRKR